MEKKQILITAGETVLRPGILSTGPRLTPTGKISHAKTRVYTQRYRKEWEQMPDFKGWLTSVQFQPTRAYCTYCKKNLHAHRLSLLKHTCTMKHQRAALQHEVEEKKKQGDRKSEVREVVEVDDADEIEALENVQAEIEENEDDIEYVVERLEMDEDELEASELKAESGIILHHQEEDDIEEEVDEEGEVSLQNSSDEEDVKPIIKKIKVEQMSGTRDTLAEAMAHVHGEYLDESESQENVELEMVVESEDQNTSDIQVLSVGNDSEDSVKEISTEEHESSRSNKKIENKIDKKAAKLVSDSKSHDPSIVMACPLPVLGTTYQINTSTAPTSNAIGVLQPINTIPITNAQNKSITLTSGGKTLTLAGGTFQPGAQYVLSKVKGNLQTLVMTEKKSTFLQSENNIKTVQVSKEQTPVASTSQQSPKKITRPIPNARKPRITTHVVDTSKGLPVGGLQVSLYKLMDGRWTFLNESSTTPGGRCVDLVDNTKVNFTAGRYKIHFDVDKYFTLRRIETIYPFIEIVFDVKNPAGHYHIPILLSPFGYTTYRGSER